jgi:hypothetical protein
MLEPAPMSQHRKCGLRDARPVTSAQFRMRPEKFAQKHIGRTNTGQETTHRIFEQPESNAASHPRAIDAAPNNTPRSTTTLRSPPNTNPRTNPRTTSHAHPHVQRGAPL